MTSQKDRQRAAARARLEREMSQRQAEALQRRTRQRYAGLSALAVVVVVGLVFGIIHLASGDKVTPVALPSPNKPATCKWTPNPDPSASPGTQTDPYLKKTGTPPTTNLPHNGTRDMVLNTSQGKITISLDLDKAPCAAESFTYLAGKGYFDKSTCHRLTTDGIYVLQCGDPSGTGEGGPAYTFDDENLPTDQQPNYPRGVVAMANPGAANENGSQFFIVTKDTPMTYETDGTSQSNLQSAYTIIGTVTGGMDVVDKIANAGVADGSTDGKPKLPVNISTVTVGPVQGGATTAPTTGTTPAPSASK